MIHDDAYVYAYAWIKRPFLIIQYKNMHSKDVSRLFSMHIHLNVNHFISVMVYICSLTADIIAWGNLMAYLVK